jgi:hypothetical protein
VNIVVPALLLKDKRKQQSTMAFLMATPRLQPKKGKESRNAQQREHDEKYEPPP